MIPTLFFEELLALMWEDLVNRLVRKFRARVNLIELSAFCAVLLIAMVSAHGVSLWYRTGGSDLKVIASVNALGDSYDDLVEDTGEKSDAIKTGAVVAQELRMSSGEREGLGISYSAFDIALPDGSDSFEYTPLLAEGVASRSDNSEDAAGSENSGKQMSQSAEGGTSAFDGELSSSSDDGVRTSANMSNMVDSEMGFGVSTGTGIVSGFSGTGSGDADGGLGTGSYSDGTPASNNFSSADTGAGNPANDAVMVPLGPLYTVKVIADGNRHVFETPGMTVAALFEQKGLVLSKHDRLTGAYLDGTISSDLFIEVTRVKSNFITVDESIDAKVIYRENSKMNKGDTNIIREGANGLRRVEYEVLYEDGSEIGRNTVSTETLREPVSKIVEQGSVGSRMDSSGNTFNYARVIDVKCTAYNSDYESTGKRPGDKAYGITASGAKAKKGIVAVDPDVIPLGTMLYIDLVDESVDDYGYAVAGDTGGKIKGKKVDLYFEKSYDELMQFGVHKAKVYILE